MGAEREIVTAAGAPPAIGPYSHAVKAAGLLYCSGQIPLQPDSGELVGENAAEQARRCLQNLHEVYGSFFASEPPARVTVGVAQLPRGAYVEIDATVAL
jgi:2-iminobutanoate/2-iminopropanoate deaminase